MNAKGREESDAVERVPTGDGVIARGRDDFHIVPDQKMKCENESEVIDVNASERGFPTRSTPPRPNGLELFHTIATSAPLRTASPRSGTFRTG